MRLAFIYLSGFFLLLLNSSNPSPPWKLRRAYNKKSPPVLSKVYKNRRAAALVEAYVLGKKANLGRKIKKYHRHLNLLHLFTPSGLHFSSILFLALPAIKLLGKIHTLLPFLFTIPLFIGPFFLSGHYAIQRVAEYRIARQLIAKKKIKIDSFWIFMGVFALDFIFGTYRQNPLSYSFSYLFWGIIFSLKNSPSFLLPFGLLGGQILVAFCFKTTLTYLGAHLGFLLIGPFVLIFPILLLNQIFPFFNFSEFLVQGFLFLVELFAQISIASGFFYPEITIVFLVFFFSAKIRSFIIPAVLLLITSFPIYNVPRYAFVEAMRVGSMPFFETSTFKTAAKKGLVPMWKHRMKTYSPD